MAGPAFDDRDGLIWMDGVLTPWRDAKVHVLTHAMHYGSAVFEGERAYGGAVFHSQKHSERLRESARILDFEVPFTVAEIDAAKALVLKENGFADAYLRPIAWRGSEMMGVSAQHNTIHLAIAAWQWPSYFDPAQRLKGIRLDIAEYRRPDPATAPCRAKAAGLYMICTISKHRAERRGYADALMFDWQGRVAECTGANVFFVATARSTPRSPTASSTASPARPRSRSRAGAARSRRAPDPARGAGDLLRMLHHRHRRRDHPGRRDRPPQLQARRDHRRADRRLQRRSAAEVEGGLGGRGPRRARA